MFEKIELFLCFIFCTKSISSEDNAESIVGRLYLMARHDSGNYYNKLLLARTAVDVAPLLSTWKVASAYLTTHRLDEGL